MCRCNQVSLNGRGIQPMEYELHSFFYTLGLNNFYLRFEGKYTLIQKLVSRGV